MGDSKKRSRRVQLETGTAAAAAARKDNKTPKRSKNVGSGRDRRAPNDRGVAGLPELVEDIQNHLRLHSIPTCTEKEKGGGASSSSSTVHSCTSIADHTLSVLSLLADASHTPSSLRSSQASELSLFLLFLLGAEPPECDGLGKMLGSQQGRLKVWELMTCMIQLTPTSRFSCVSDRIATAVDALVAHWQQGPTPSLCTSFMEDAVTGIEICENLLRCRRSKVLKEDNTAASHLSPENNVIVLFRNLGELIGGAGGIKIEVTSPSHSEYLLVFLTLVMEKLAKHIPQFVVGTSLIWRMWKHLTNQLTSVVLLYTENENTTGNDSHCNQLMSVQLKTILTFLSLENPPPDCVLQLVSSSILTLLEELFSECSSPHHQHQFPFSSICLEYLERLVDVLFLCREDGGGSHRTTPPPSISSVLPTFSTWCIKNEELLQQGGLKEKYELACILLRSIAKHIRHYHRSIELHYIPYLCNMAHVWQLQTPIVDCISAIIIHQLPEEVKRALFLLNNNEISPSREENFEISHQPMHALPEWSIVRLIQMTERRREEGQQQQLKCISDITRLTSVIRILLPFFGSNHHPRDEDEDEDEPCWSSLSVVVVPGGRLLNLLTLFLSSFASLKEEKEGEQERCSLLKLEEDCLNTTPPTVNTTTTTILMIRMDCCLSILRWIPNFLQTLNNNEEEEASEGNVHTITTITAAAAVVENLILQCLKNDEKDGSGSGLLARYNNNRQPPPSKSSFEIDATTMIQTTFDINDLHYLQPLQRTLVFAFCFYPWSPDGYKELLNRVSILLSFESPEYVQCTTLLSFPILIETCLLAGAGGGNCKDDLVLAAMNVYSNHLDAFLVSITTVTERKEVKSTSSSSCSSTTVISSNVKGCVLHSAYILACIATHFCLPPDNNKCRPVSTAAATEAVQQQQHKEMCSSSLPTMIGIRVIPTSCQMQQELDHSSSNISFSFSWWTSQNVPLMSPSVVVVPEPDLLPPSIYTRRDILKCCRKLGETLLQDCIAESQMWVGTLPLIIQLIRCESHKYLKTKEIEEDYSSSGNIMGRILRKLLEALSEKGDSEVGNAVALIAGMYASHETTVLQLLNLTKREDLGKLIDCMIDSGEHQSSSNVDDETTAAAAAAIPFFTPEHQCHLRAIGSIGSSADISSDGGRYWITWSMLRLIHVWVDKLSPFQFMAYDELRRICQSTCPPVLELFSNDNISGCEEVLPTLLEAVLKHGKGCTERFLEQILCVRDTRTWLDARLHHILPTLISDRRIDTIEQISVLWDHMHNGELFRIQKASMARTPPSLASCLMLRSNTIQCVIKEILLGCVNVKSELRFVVQTFYPQNKLKHFLHEQLEPVLCLVARELGGKRHNAAVKAINRMTSILESPLYPTARDMVRDKFLYLMSHVVAKSSPLRPQLDRHQAILVLEELVRYFNAEDSACFAPKVFATLSSALADPSARAGNPIRVTAYRIVCKYTRVLPVAALGTHLSTIVVTLLPALLECEEIMSSKSSSNVRQEALDLLHYLVITQQKALCTHFCTIPFLPRIPELKHIATILEEEVGRPALADQLQQLSKLLQHEESIAVRLALLRHLLQVLRDGKHQGELGAILAPSNDSVDSAIEKLLGCLLRISSSSGNVEIRDICASCLGQIGAVDPSHIPSLRLSEWTAGLPTWGFSTEDLSLLLLREHLVPALRAATSSIDRVAYGIQELVYLMEQSCVDETKKKQPSHHLSAPPQLKEIDDESSSSNNTSKKKRRNDKMPEWLIRNLREHGILDAVEPFWITNYILRDSMDPSMQFPIFRAQIVSPTGSSLERYISLWCRHLISNSHGPMQPIFKACRGVVRASVGVAQFLLPHLAVDTILFGTESDREDLLNEVVAVLSVDLDLEKGGGGKATANSFHHVAIQAIFKLLDTLNEWMNGGTPPLGTNWPKPRERLYALRNFIELIPRNVLIDASIGIKAHTRALLYLEEQLRIHTRGGCIGGGNQISDMSLNDGANGTLPAITAHSLQQLVDICRRISSEPDAMSGLEVLRRKFGCPPTLKQRIWQHEHAEEWFEALQVYEHTLQSSRPGHNNSDSSLHVGLWDPGERELGVLRCHMSLGQYQLVLHQTNGMLMMPTLSDHQNPTTIGSLILPLAIEASWRLQRWSLTEDLLNDYDQTLIRCNGGSENITNASSRLTSHQEPPPSPLLPEDSFRVALARVLLLFHENKGTTTSSSSKSGNFEGALRTARAEVMGQLAAASMESYQRAYPFLLQLHTLTEVEQVWLIRSQNPAVGVVRPQQQQLTSSSIVTFESLNWSSRLELLAPNLRQVEPLLAVRQTILQNENMDDLAVENFLCLGKAARVATCFSVAACALERVGMLDVTDLAKEKLVMQEAKLAYARGHIDRALLILEPVDLNVGSVQQQWLSQSSSSAVKGGTMRIKQYNFARRLLWATNWMVESGQCHGKHVVDRYKLALELQPGEKGHFALGQYMDFLLQSRAEEVQDEITQVIGTDELARKYAVETLRCYAECLRHGSKYIFQSMPRLLTLWFEVCALGPETPTRRISRGLSNTSSRVTAAVLSGNNSEFADLRQTQRSCTAIVQTAMTEVPPYMWYTCLPQLMSRVGHPKDEVVAVVSQALVNIISAHPHQALWQVSGLALSLSETRRKIGQRIINRATLRLRTEGDAECVKDAIQLFEELIAVAMDKPDSASRGNASYVIGKNINLNRFVVPTQAALTVSLPNKVVKPPATLAVSKSKQRNKDHQQYPRYEPDVIFPRGQIHIRKFWERVRIVPSKAQPKKISLQTVESGETLHFLCKQERNGDLRKDARLMEFNGVVNRLLARDNAGRRRKLRLRTYSVICLNEECGIIEWVQGTTAFRHLVSEGYRIGPPRKSLSNDQLKDLMKRIQEKTGSLEEMVDLYRSQLLPRFPPSLHRWFTEHFREPTAWFDGRTTFTRSAALWSAVGHVVGLGDRHGENLLLHTEGGECVHVDFDCLFDKGLILARPEIVPFRLTPNMVDGMGVTGYEGVFRRVMEVTMQVLRDNRRLLLSVLEPFLQDPTVGWRRIGRAQRPTDEKLGEKDKLKQNRRNVAQDMENEDARRTLRVIEGRLRGVYNVKVPRKRRKFIPLRKGDPRPVHQQETNELPLSVPGQVQRLINESISHENLCQMYIGW